MANTDAQASFAINLEDVTSGAAASATKGLETLRNQIDGDTRALAAMQRAMKNIQGGTVVNIKQFKELQAGIASKKSAIAQAQSSFLSLGGTFVKTGGAGRGLETRFAAMIAQTKGMPGPLGALVSKFEGLKAAVGGGVIALGLVAIAAGLVLLVAATAAAVASLYRYGVAQADARRNELLRIEGLTKMRNWYGLAAGNAKEMQASIDLVSASSALGRDKIAAYSDQLYRMGLRGDNLSAALEGVAIKSQVQGEAAASAFAGWAAGAARTGQSVRRLSDDVKARLGGIAAAQLLSVGAQAQKMQKDIAALFNGLDDEQLLKGMASVKNLLSQSTNSGKALKQMLDLLLQPLVDAATRAQPIIKRFFQGMILGAQGITIAVLDVLLWFKRTFGAPDVLKGFDKQHAALVAGKAAVGLLAAGLGVASIAAAALSVKLATMLVPAMWNLVRSVGALAIEGLVIAAPFLLAAAAIFAVINTARLLYQLWKEIDWKDLGTSIWKGMVKGLSGGAKYVIDAVKNIGSSARAAFKSMLGISSPSKAFAKLGLAIPMGVGVGVEQGTPDLRRAVGGMVSMPNTPRRAVGGMVSMPNTPRRAVGGMVSMPNTPRLGDAPQRGPERAAAAGPRSSSVVNIGEIHLHTQSDKPKEMAQDFKRELERILEGVAIQLGAPMAGAQ